MPKSKNTYPEITDIREDLDSLRSNVVELTKHLTKDGGNQTRELQKLLQTRLNTMKEKGREQLKTAERRIKAKPVQSIAMAFAAGLVLSALMRRR